jgi:F0F1-type ATP synthase assembly protein I
MKPDTPDERSPMAIGLEWSTRLILVGLEMALPAAGGCWLDLRCGTLPVFVIIGTVLGLSLGTWNFVRIARELNRKNK